MRIKIYSPYMDESGQHDFYEFGTDEITPARYDKALCSGSYSVGNVAVGSLKITVPRRLFNLRSKLQLFRGDEKIHGDFFIEKRQEVKRGKWLNLTCYDALYKANDYWTRLDKNLFSSAEILSEVCARIGADTDGSCTGYSYPTDELYGKTLKEILSFVGKDFGGNFAMRGDVLCFIPLWFVGMTYTTNQNSMIYDNFNLDYQYFSRVKMGEFDSGTDGGEVLYIDSNYETAEKCETIMTNIANVPYKPFNVGRVKISDNFDLGDTISLEERAGIVYKPMEISAVYHKYGCYASLSADRSAESQTEFKFEGPISLKLKNKLEKDKKYGGNQIGDYGFKSISVPSPAKTRTRAAAGKTTQLMIKDGVISGSDITDPNAPIDSGRICVDDDGAVNVHSKGLLTEAQDFKGAINELFGQGASGGWVRPVSWLPLPEPEPNQAVFLIVPEDESPITGEIIISISNAETDNPPTGTVDFGAGYDVVDLETLENAQSNKWYKVVPIPENYGGGYEQKIITVTITSGAVKINPNASVRDVCFGAEWSTEFDNWCNISGGNKINHIKKIGAPETLGWITHNYSFNHYFDIDASKLTELRTAEVFFTRMYFPKVKKLYVVSGELNAVSSCRLYGMTTLYLPELDEVDFNGGSYNYPDGYISSELMSDIVCPVKFKTHPAFKEFAEGKNGVRWIDPMDLKEYGGNLDFKLR